MPDDRSVVIGPYTIELHHGDGTKTVLNTTQWARCRSGDLFREAEILWPDALRMPADANPIEEWRKRHA